jgi:misacylated tRNA(Ala) deacylase
LLVVTRRLYLDDSYQRDFDSEVVACEDAWCRLAATAFHPGGGGQPCDRGQLVVDDEPLAVTAVREDVAGVWHQLARPVAVGRSVRGTLDWPHRYAIMRHHALLHVVNTIAFRELGALITGAQIGAESSRIDLRVAGFSRDQLASFEGCVNDVIARDLPLTAVVIGEDEFRRRPDLIRTLNVQPPVVDGRVRIVEIGDFDAQACGGTHVHTTGEIGRVRLARFDNKGKDNKRFYWETSQ